MFHPFELYQFSRVDSLLKTAEKQRCFACKFDVEIQVLPLLNQTTHS